MMKENRFFTIYIFLSVLLACFATGCLALVSDPGLFLVFRIILAVLSIGQIILSVLLIILAFLPVSRLHTPVTAFQHFIRNIAEYFEARRLYLDVVAATKNVRQSQDVILKSLLSKNANTSFGKRFGFSKITNRRKFQETVPLSTYADYESYMARIVKGEQNVLTSDDVVKLSLSSGTTGKPKLVPYIWAMLPTFSKEGAMRLQYEIRMQAPLRWRFAPLKMLDFRFSTSWRFSEGGLPIGFASQHRSMPPTTSFPVSTPTELMAEQMGEHAQAYIHLLFALIDDNLHWIWTIYAGLILVSFEFLQANWQQLAEDIRQGRITNNQHDIPDEIIAKIENHAAFCSGNPQRALQIETECGNGFQNIAKRLWPKIDYVWGIVSGPHEVYIDRLRYFIGPDVNIVSHLYASSEGMIGSPIGNEQLTNFTYTLLTRTNFFEFIPEDEVFHKNPRTLFTDQLELGKRYELVMTPRCGFCRYRMGDIVSIDGFYNEAPVINFKSRVGGILDLNGEKTSEDMMNSALKKASLLWKGFRLLLDYTVTDSITFEKASSLSKSSDLHYVIFGELSGIERPLTEVEVEAFDDALSNIHMDYKDDRKSGIIAKPKIFVERPGTFKKLQSKVLEKLESVSNQYKQARYQKNIDLLQFLVENAYSR